MSAEQQGLGAVSVLTHLGPAEPFARWRLRGHPAAVCVLTALLSWFAFPLPTLCPNLFYSGGCCRLHDLYTTASWTDLHRLQPTADFTLFLVFPLFLPFAVQNQLLLCTRQLVGKEDMLVSKAYSPVLLQIVFQLRQETKVMTVCSLEENAQVFEWPQLRK